MGEQERAAISAGMTACCDIEQALLDISFSKYSGLSHLLSPAKPIN
jgi:hypothetical protein